MNYIMNVNSQIELKVYRCYEVCSCRELTCINQCKCTTGESYKQYSTALKVPSSMIINQNIFFSWCPCLSNMKNHIMWLKLMFGCRSMGASETMLCWRQSFMWEGTCILGTTMPSSIKMVYGMRSMMKR